MAWSPVLRKTSQAPGGERQGTPRTRMPSALEGKEGRRQEARARLGGRGRVLSSNIERDTLVCTYALVH